MRKQPEKDQIVLVRIDRVLGYLYLPSEPTNKAVIHAKGGPSLGDDGKSPLWAVAKRFGRILFVPDYIGYCRSYGVFNFQNCVETIYEVEDFLRGKRGGLITDTNQPIKLACDDIVLEGSSWGGSIVPFLEKYRHSQINDIAIVKGVTDWASLDNGEYEETDTAETSNFAELGWANIYRGYAQSEWPQIFRGKLRECNPIDNIALLKDKRVYIAHGENDTSVNWHRSKVFYDKLRQTFLDMPVYWKMLDTGHGGEANALGLEFMLETIEMNKTMR